MDEHDIKAQLESLDLSDSKSIEDYARNLVGASFQDILDLGISPEGIEAKDYSDKNYKGGYGTLIEERFFGYKANSDSGPDFAEAGVELKSTCFDRREATRNKPERIVAGERLVLGMIPHDSEIPEDLFSSHVWNKCKLMLLVYYYRDKTVEPLQRRIRYVRLFEIPEEDLPIIEEDYRTIAKLIREGRADELSEGMTAYLGACTKGRTAATMQAKQFYPYIHEDGREEYRTAKRRAFSLKQSYMDYILHHYMADDHSPLDFDFSSRPEAVEVDSSPHGRKADGKAPTFEESVINALDRYVGMDATELMRAFNVKNATGGEAKNRYASLACHMLGYTSNKALALEKAGISVRAIRARANWSVKESLSLDTFEFSGLLDEPSWEESKLFEYLDSTKFLFLVFHGEPGAMRFAGACFWHMSARELQQDVRRCWEDTKYTILNGVEWSEKRRRNGSAIHNNLPGKSDNPICHVRPHANRRGYIYADGRQIGEKKDMSELPDGRWMTRQSFWINNDYLAKVIEPVRTSYEAR